LKRLSVDLNYDRRLRLVVIALRSEPGLGLGDISKALGLEAGSQSRHFDQIVPAGHPHPNHRHHPAAAQKATMSLPSVQR
jgi:hypothetical protein